MHVREINVKQDNQLTNLVLQDIAMRQRQCFLQFTLDSIDDVRTLKRLLDQFDLISQASDLVVTCFVPVAALPLLRQRCLLTWANDTLVTDFKVIEQQHAIYWQTGRFNFNVSQQPVIYGILNITPDSFYDGGRFQQQEQIQQQIAAMVSAGVNVIEVGGQTTRPGFNEISAATEIERIMPVIKIIKSYYPNIAVAVDTYKYDVMQAVVQANVDIINDVNAFIDDSRKLKLLAPTEIGLLTMHSSRSHEYQNLTQEMKQFFETNLTKIMNYGIVRQRIALDQGIGYAKEADGYQDYAMMRNIDQFNYLQRPMMIAISRKGFGAKLFGLAKDDRLPVTLVAEAYMYLHGGNILRVHDVTETVQLVKMLDTIKNGYWFKK